MCVFYAISSIIVRRGYGLDNINYPYQFLLLIIAVLKSAGLREARREFVATVNTHNWSNYQRAGRGGAMQRSCALRAAPPALACGVGVHICKGPAVQPAARPGQAASRQAPLAISCAARAQGLIQPSAGVGAAH